MITILMVLALSGMSVTIDMTGMYGAQTIDECRVLIPWLQEIYQAESAFCAVGDILNPVEDSI
ncbi:MAG: hypothetical protein ACPHL3_01295 [Paracoccaceae bacterium]|jgi:hypothetical protein